MASLLIAVDPIEADAVALLVGEDPLVIIVGSHQTDDPVTHEKDQPTAVGRPVKRGRKGEGVQLRDESFRFPRGDVVEVEDVGVAIALVEAIVLAGQHQPTAVGGKADGLHRLRQRLQAQFQRAGLPVVGKEVGTTA